VDAEGLKSSKQAAMGAIQDPVSLFVQQRNILSLPAIQALQKTAGPLLDLLRVFQEGKLEDYYSFVQSNGGDAVLSQWGLSPDECIRHMRILSLCSLAAEHEEIPYQVVADTLQTTAGEVEKWVIAAVSSGLLSAKMDQLQEKVIVERCVVRKFDMDQWKALQSRLNLWKQNVGGILEAYKQSLQQHQ
jgi:translation initiation factor 3 subunit M